MSFVISLFIFCLYEQPIIEAQLCGVELLETVLSLHTSPNKHTGVEPILEVLKHLLAVQADLELSYVPRLSSAILSLFIILVDTDLEHEQLSILDFFYFLLKWKGENGMFSQSNLGGSCCLACFFSFRCRCWLLRVCPRGSRLS